MAYFLRHFAEAVKIARTEEQRFQIAKSLISVGKNELLEKLGLPVPKQEAVPPGKVDAGHGAVSGVVKFPDGKPASQVKITLGLKVELRYLDASHEMDTSLGDHPFVGPQETLVTETDATGTFRFEKVPAGRQDFIAVSLDPQKYEISTRFLVQGIEVTVNHETKFELSINDWSSAPAREVKSPFAEEIRIGGATGRRVFEQFFKNPFFFSFPRQLVRIAVPPGVTTNP